MWAEDAEAELAELSPSPDSGCLVEGDAEYGGGHTHQIQLLLHSAALLV